ncbi:MAG: hypothetical protein WCL16_12610, partial [bacterium]
MAAAVGGLPASPCRVRPGTNVQIFLIQNGVSQSLMGGPGSYVVGDAAKFTNVTLTVGTDLDSDGLPDAWEEEIIGWLNDPRYNTIWDINPNDDADGDGVSNLSEFLAGTFAFISEDYFRIFYRTASYEPQRRLGETPRPTSRT